MFMHIFYNYTPHFYRQMPGFSGNTHNSPLGSPHLGSAPPPPLSPVATHPVRGRYGKLPTFTGKEIPAESAGLSFPVWVARSPNLPRTGSIWSSNICKSWHEPIGVRGFLSFRFSVFAYVESSDTIIWRSAWSSSFPRAHIVLYCASQQRPKMWKLARKEESRPHKSRGLGSVQSHKIRARG